MLYAWDSDTERIIWFYNDLSSLMIGWEVSKKVYKWPKCVWLNRTRLLENALLGKTRRMSLKKKVCESLLNKNSKRHPSPKQIRLIGLKMFLPCVTSVNSSGHIAAVLG